ncbi:hypothetical protein HHI36_002185 [Cryptolaemus montrouzieri]|uniref:Uncharacterized protein n=1 Tax=Cryptolaemus montrouzieri TaxID=559131 RepID=A0ABD2PAP0_9CUCU
MFVVVDIIANKIIYRTISLCLLRRESRNVNEVTAVGVDQQHEVDEASLFIIMLRVHIPSLPSRGKQ